MMAAKASAINIPFWPQKARPASMSRSVMTVSMSVVLNMLLIISASVLWLYSLDAGNKRWALIAPVWGGHSCPPLLTLVLFCARQSKATPRSKAADRSVRPTRTSGLPFQCPLERLVEGCFGFFVIRGRDLALFSFYLELEKFFFQRFEQHRRFCGRRAGRRCSGRGGWTDGCTIDARRRAGLRRGGRGD